MSVDEFPQADRIEGAAHPRQTLQLFGQAEAERIFLQAFNAGRLHHGWLLTGPNGVGKATLAWKIARFLLSQPVSQDAGMDMFGEAPIQPSDLEIDSDHPIHGAVVALSAPGLFLLRRPYDQERKRLKQDITIDELRTLKAFLALSSPDGRRRVVIIDSVDELNISAANAVLKMLEEPPENTIILLISHQPARLLPTIRSRCHELRCVPLEPDDMARALAAAGLVEVENVDRVAALSSGSVGAALQMTLSDGLGIYAQIIELAQGFPNMDRMRALKLADRSAGSGAESHFRLTVELLDIFLSRLAKAGIGFVSQEAAAGEFEQLARLSPDAGSARVWAQLAAGLTERARRGRSVNLDPSSLVLDLLLAINETAGRTAA
ncbi:MAG: DNA polymerase III subunit delta' [Pseudomonadota bacterium]